MQAKLLKDCPGVAFDDPTKQVLHPKGTVITDPKVWVHCLPGLPVVVNGRERIPDPIAEPADEECREAVAKFMARTTKKQPQLSPAKTKA